MNTVLSFIAKFLLTMVITLKWRYWSAFLLFNLSFISLTSAQNILWEKTIGGSGADSFSSIHQTQDGGYILGGRSDSGVSPDKSQPSKGSDDYWIMKLNADGTIAWDKTIGGNWADELAGVQQTSDGGYILGGTSNSAISGDKSEASKGHEDYWIVKLNADGSKAWDKTIGGTEWDYLREIKQTSDGGYILGGYSYSTAGADKSEPNRGPRGNFNLFETDYWIVKLAADGTKVWDKTLGGASEDVFTAMELTKDGGVLVGGYSYSGVSGDKTSDKGSGDFWLVKLRGDGTKAWDKTIGGSGEDYLFAMQQTREGGFILGGASRSEISQDKSEASLGGYWDCWVVKINAAGNILWDKTLGGSENEAVRSIQQTQDGGYILGGESDSEISRDKSEATKGNDDYWVVKLNAEGSKVWDKTIGGNDYEPLQSIQQTQDGNYIIGGWSRSGIGGDKSESIAGFGDIWLVKLQDAPASNKMKWDQRYGSLGNDNFTSAIKTQDGGYLAGGYTSSGIGGNKSQSNQGKNDYWIVKTDESGQRQWEKSYGGSDDDYLNRVIQTRDGGYLLAGSSLSGKSGDKSEASKGNRDYWVVKVDARGNKEWDKTFGGSGYEELQKVVQLASGEYVLGGYSNSPVSGDKTQNNQGGNDYWLVKISTNGTKLWDQRYGGDKDETLGSFTETNDGGFFLGGTSLSDKSGDKSQASRGGQDYWTVKTDLKGNLVWEKTWGGSGVDEVYSVANSGSGFFFAGTSNSGKNGDKSQSSQGGKDYWLVKVNARGDKVWDQTYGGSKDDDLRASSRSLQGGLVLAGTSFSDFSGDKSQSSQGGSDYWIVQVDAEGKQVYDKCFGGGGTEELWTAAHTEDGGLLLGGRSGSNASGDKTQTSQGRTDYWLVKVAPEPITTVATVATTETKSDPAVKLITVQVYPNPFQEKVTVSFSLPETQAATIRVLDSQGKQIATLFEEEAQANQTYQLEWQAGKQKAGIYLLQLQTPTGQSTQKLFLNK